MSRRTFNKREKIALYLEAEGRCKKCGTVLGSDMHADHVIPFVVSKTTDILNGQALCPQCNLRKGSKMLRKPQQELKILAEKIADGVSPVKKIIASVVPGGGKSMMPAIIGKPLQDAGLIDKICWIVPRRSLQEQGAREFLMPFSKNIVGHNMTIREVTNKPDPSGGLSGYITTYQAIGTDVLNLNAKEFSRYRYLLVLDEPHHVVSEGAWHKALQPLVDQCAYLLMMSGTLSRSDKKPIAFLDYIHNSTRELIIDDHPRPDQAFIRYGRREALDDRNILPVDFRYMDGKSEWIDKEGLPASLDTFTDYSDESTTKDAIWAALQTGYAEELLRKSIEDWTDYKNKINPRSKMIVVAARQRFAKTYQKWLEGKGIKSRIAVSDDSKAAADAIKDFKTNKVDCLVTVAMAYEGLDVPSITHIACLTHIRSQEWLDQMFGRATRVDRHREAPPVDSQWAFAWVPDDPFMQEAVDRIRNEQLTSAREFQDPNNPGLGGNPSKTNHGEIIAMSSAFTRQRIEGDDDIIGYSETESILKAMKDNGIYGVSPVSFLNAMKQAGMVANSSESDDFVEEGEILTPKQREDNLKKSIEDYCRKHDFYQNLPYGTTNKKLFQVFKKSRDVMPFAELTKVWKYIQSNFPMHKDSEWGI